ncbi:hypothetical protein GGI17_002272 [Coemansia sp. S146]|nr:hypothetical protein GGI17_002272 [Coemansia sp. S146]
MSSYSDDGGFLFIPAALQSNPPTPTRLSMSEGAGSIKCAGDVSHFQTAPIASVALQAFPRPRDSVDGAVSIDGEAGDGDSSSAVDLRLERRKRNQYKRHGSLTLAWQQRLSGGGSREPELVRTRLSSEIDACAGSGSPIPTPVNATWYRPNRSSGTVLLPGKDRQETLRRLDSQQSATVQTQRQSRWRSGSLATVSPANAASSLAYGYGGSSRAGSSLFAPVNSFHAGSNSASQLYQSGHRRNGDTHSNRSSTSISSSHESSNRGPSATRTSDNGSADYVPARTSYGCGTIGNNGDGARRLATPSTGSYIVHSPGLSSVPVPAPHSHAQQLANGPYAVPPTSRLGGFSDSIEDADLSDSDSDRASVLMIACTTNRSDARFNGRGASLAASHELGGDQRLSECSAHFTDASPRNEWLAASSEQLHFVDMSGSTDGSPRLSSAVMSARSSGGSDFYEALYADAEYNLVPLGLRGDSASPDANMSVSSSGRGIVGELPAAVMTREMSGSGGHNQASVAFDDNCRGGDSGRELSKSPLARPSSAAQFDMPQSTSAPRGSYAAAPLSSRLASDASTDEAAAGVSFSSSSCLQGCQSTFFASHYSSLVSRPSSSSASFFSRSVSAFPTLDTASPPGPLCSGGSSSGLTGSTSTQVLLGGPATNTAEYASPTEQASAGRVAIAEYSRHALLVCNPPNDPLPLTPVDMAVSSLSLSTATPPLCTSIQPLSQTPISSSCDGSSKSAGSTANTTAVCTPATLTGVRPGYSKLELGELTKVHEGISADSAASKVRGIAESPTQLIADRRQRQSEDVSKRIQATVDLAPSKPVPDECGSIYAGGSANGTYGDRPLHDVDTSQGTRPDRSAAPCEDLTRHPTLIFDHSPILRASELIGASPTESVGPSSMPATPSDSGRVPPMHEPSPNIASRNKCRTSEEFAHESGIAYTSDAGVSDEPVLGSLPDTSSADTPSALPRPRVLANGAHSRTGDREAAEASLCRNSLFPNVVKQQSRCMSVLLQQGPHGGIRRIGPLLITQERGGGAIKHLNPAFIDMMDVQPVDASTAAFLKRSNIRRRSFSMPPNGPGSDWLNTLTHIISGSGGSKRTNDPTSAGPGMWWPLNDDNCSDEVTHDVHMSSQDGPESSNRITHSQQAALERMGSSSAITSAALKPPPVLGAPRKGSVSSQLRLMTRADSSQGNIASGGAYLRSNASQSSLAGHVPSLTHTTSDASDMSTSSACVSRQHSSLFASNGLSMHTAGTQLADVTMRTESGVITRSIKYMSLRLLVNRLASPEGNVDSDLMTDFLNSYRFFAHPIDVMRLIVARYLNCFATGAPGDDTEDSEIDDAEASAHDGDDKFLTINGWRDNPSNDVSASSGDRAGHPAGSKSEPKQTSTRQLPPLARNDGAIIQLRVMNIVKYWIKFHPHDFRLHHRLTRLLLLFLSHIQKQPGRAEFVNATRQKLSSGKLLAVEMPAFASSSFPPGTPLSTAVPSQASSMRNSGVRTPTLEHARSALDLRSAVTHHGPPLGASALSRPEFALSELNSVTDISQPNGGGGGGSHLHTSVSLLDMHGQPSIAGSASRQLPGSGPSIAQAPAAAGSRAQHAKKGSASYFKSLFHPRSSRANTGNLSSIDAGGETDAFGGLNAGSIRIAQRDDGSSTGTGSELVTAAGGPDLRMPNGNMYASDFGSLVMEALTKSGIPTPQTPVGRTLLNYSIANRNPYRVNLVGIDPATFAEQLTLLEHELFSRISATEFSLKGRVGNLETILHTMQGVAADSRNSVSTLGGSGQPGQANSTNPVPSLTAMTSWFNQATYWAVLAVLSEPTSAARALVIKQLVHVAFHCLARRNYYGAFEIVIALDNSAVRRLYETWALVPVLMKDIVARILQVLQSRMNFRTYRESVKAAMAGVSGPDEEVFEAISDQIKSIRAKDMVSASQANIVTSSGISSATSTGHSAASSGFGNLVNGAFFGSGGDDSKHHMRKKSIANVGASSAKDAGQLTEQDCACITYAIRIRAASFMYFDPSTSNGPPGHSSVPVSSSSKGGRGSGGHLSSSSSKSSGHLASSGSGPTSASSSSGGSEASEARSRRARSASNSSNGAAGGRTTPTFRNGRMITNGAPLPLVPFVAVHMTDLLHADEANSTYSEEHQKMRSRNPTGPEIADDSASCLIDSDMAGPANKRQLRCDSAAISSVNQAQPLLNMQKFRLITSMFRELHLAQRTKYPYAADTMLQQQIYSAVRNIKAQTNDIFAVVQDVAATNPLAVRPHTSHAAPFTRNRTGSSASRLATTAPDLDGSDQGAFGYPLYQIAALQKSHSGTSLLDVTMDWDCTDVKDNQELEQRLYMLSKWIEPQATATHR